MKISDDWIRTEYLWCWQQPLYQLSHTPAQGQKYGYLCSILKRYFNVILVVAKLLTNCHSKYEIIFSFNWSALRHRLSTLCRWKCAFETRLSTQNRGLLSGSRWSTIRFSKSFTVSKVGSEQRILTYFEKGNITGLESALCYLEIFNRFTCSVWIQTG